MYSIVLHVQLLSIFFIDSDFVIIIYIPYTCLRVCYKHMLSLMYDFFSVTTRTIYLVIVSNNIDCSWRFFVSSFNF